LPDTLLAQKWSSTPLSAAVSFKRSLCENATLTEVAV